MERPSENLIYNRSLKDVQRVAELNRKISAGSASAEEVQEWFSAKGALNYEDLNRIESWTEFLSNQLKSYGYNAPITKRAEQTYTYYEKPEPGDEPVARLPEGYRELTYIESTGTQYVDTGFKPNGNTGVTIDFQLTVASGWQCVLGARTGANTKSYSLWHSGSAFGFYYANVNQTFSSLNGTDRHHVVATKNNAVADGTSSVSLAFSNFNADYSLYLFASNSDGTATSNASMRLYPCQIYDNGTIVRDYVPCINAQGAAGLYDMANDVFYANAGSGTFVTGEMIEYIENVGGGSNGPTAITVTYADWRVWDIPHITELNRIRDNVSSLRDGFYSLSDWREIAYKNNPNFEDVNTLEWDMQTIYNWLKLMVLNFKYSGEAYAGEAW